MSEASRPSYHALRVCPRADARRWWASARAADAVPPAIACLLAGRARVEVSAEEAADALTWARKLPGWDDDSLAPLVVHPAAQALTDANST